ncbi:hypothetical protein PE067_08770 [Paracoccus sp. DMF-8]|uniref:phage head-tail joining protein n=1 Tax=Paracoccus sp. DMF-8 TaxID=3019445 RepID=UPI0023E7C178|nr:hypothetical protein [Paracoccus sp. DMF-8]MDF3606216.1 hypothetical protein [Paracoccus sp. DMF-8]
MAVPVEDLAQMRDALLRARAKGVKSLRVGSELIEYKTDAEMSDAINDLEARIARASAPRPAMVRFTNSKGF